MFLLALPIFHHVKNEIKKEVKYKILKRRFNESELVEFSELDLQSADWEDAEEFFFQGSMYDVVKVVRQNGMKYYYCIKDQKENYILPLKKNADLFKKKNLKLNFDTQKDSDFSVQQYSMIYCKEIEFLNVFFKSFKNKINYSILINVQDFYILFFKPPENYC